MRWLLETPPLCSGVPVGQVQQIELNGPICQITRALFCACTSAAWCAGAHYRGAGDVRQQVGHRRGQDAPTK